MRDSVKIFGGDDSCESIAVAARLSRGVVLSWPLPFPIPLEDDPLFEPSQLKSWSLSFFVELFVPLSRKGLSRLKIDVENDLLLDRIGHVFPGWNTSCSVAPRKRIGKSVFI